MQVADILNDKGNEVVTTQPQEAVGDVSRRMQLENIGAVPVRDRDGAIVGIISERDIVHGIAEKGQSALDLSVSDLMSTPVVFCTTSTDIEELMEKMITGRIRHLPVVDDGDLVGIVSIGDVVKGVVAELKWVKNALAEQVAHSAAWSTDED